MARTPRLAAGHIIDNVDQLQRALEGKTRAAYDGDPLLQAATERFIERIAEASRFLAPEQKAAHQEIDWRKIAATGNILRHDYEHVRQDIIWEVATDRLPLLRQAVAQIAAQLDQAPRPLIPALVIPDLTPDQLQVKLAGVADIAEQREDVGRLSLGLFNRRDALTVTLDKMDTDATKTRDIGERVAKQLRTKPEEIAPGNASKATLRNDLADAVETYGHAVAAARTDIVREHRKEQRRAIVEVPMPSEKLAAVFKAPAQQRGAMITADKELFQELKALNTKISQRLAPADFRAIAAGDQVALSANVAVPIEQAKEIAETRAAVVGALQEAQAHQKAVHLARGEDHKQ
jgi:uncharacterized protein with HEPN domain